MIYISIENIKNDRVSSSLIGMKIEEFKELAKSYEKEIIEEKERAYKEGERKRKYGGGAKGNFRNSGSEIIFCTLLYEKLSYL